MTRLALLLERVRARWNGPWTLALRGLARLLLGRLFAAVVGLSRVIWARLGGRARVAAMLAALILISSRTESVAPSFSVTAHRLAVLLVAGIGLWLMLTSPFRGRRW